MLNSTGIAADFSERQAIVRTVPFSPTAPSSDPRFGMVLALRHGPTSWIALWIGVDDTMSNAQYLQQLPVDKLRLIFDSWRESIIKGEQRATRDPRAYQVVHLNEEHGPITEQIDRRFGLRGIEIAATAATVQRLWCELRAITEPLAQMEARAALGRHIDHAIELLESVGYSHAAAQEIAGEPDL